MNLQGTWFFVFGAVFAVAHAIEDPLKGTAKPIILLFCSIGFDILLLVCNTYRVVQKKVYDVN